MNHSTYTTDDAAVVTVLNMHGLHPRSVNTEGGKVWFRFERTTFLTEVLDSYDRGALQVSAKDVRLALSRLRDPYPEFRRATDIDLPSEPVNTRSVAQREYQKLKRGAK